MLFFSASARSSPIIFFLLTSYLIAKRGLEVISRAAWLIIPTIQFLFVILVISVWKEVSFLHIFPIAGPGLKQLTLASLSHSALVSELILLSAFFTFNRSYKSYRFASLIGFIISCVQLALFLALYIMVFDYPSTLKMAYPHQQLTRIAEFGENLSHVEGVFLFLDDWIRCSLFNLFIFDYLLICRNIKIGKIRAFNYAHYRVHLHFLFIT
ncbi:GerAB/ArcD/ProY family transporter [Bacillus sp. N9]